MIKINRNMKQTIKLTENELHNIIKESIMNILKENTEQDYLEKLYQIREEIGDNLSLRFNDIDVDFIENKFGNRFQDYLKKCELNDNDKHYVARFFPKNTGWGDKNACVLGILEFTGYSVTTNYLCELSFEEFYKLLQNFEYIGGHWVRKNTFKY
jgi:hypothetical protein